MVAEKYHQSYESVKTYQHTSHSDDFWNTVAMLALKAPFLVGVVAGLGYLGNTLLTTPRNSSICRRQLIGGIMVACITSLLTYLFLTGAGMTNDILAFGLSSVIGMSGKEGFILLKTRAAEILKTKGE
jgi:hypothetical protein